MNQRIRFKGPRREWHAPRGGPGVSIAPERLENRADIEIEMAATAAATALALHVDEASWQSSSSHDLRSGLQVTEFEDTVPAGLLDDLGL